MWVAGDEHPDRCATAWRIDPRFDTMERGAGIPSPECTSDDVALDRGAVWVAPAWGLLTRQGRRTGAVRRSRSTPCMPPRRRPRGAIGLHAERQRQTVTKVDSWRRARHLDPPRWRARRDRAGAGSGGRPPGRNDELVQLDPGSTSVRRTIEVGGRPAGVAVGAGAVWVANSRDGTVTRVDPATGDVVGTSPCARAPRTWRSQTDAFWEHRAEDGRRGAEAGRGRDGRVAEEQACMDPALAWGVIEWTLGYATGAQLLNYPDGSRACGGSRLVPEVAEALPEPRPTAGPYTFKIRPGFCSPRCPGERVTAETFKRSIERSLQDPRMKGPSRATSCLDVFGVGRDPAPARTDHLAGERRMRRTRLAIRAVHARFRRLPGPGRDALLLRPCLTDAPVAPDGVPPCLASAGPYYAAS